MISKNNFMKLNKVCLMAILIALFLITSATASLGKKPKVVLFLVDNTSINDWVASGSPYLTNLVNNSSLGLINNQTDGLLTRQKEYLTIGGGARAKGSIESGLALSGYENYQNSKATSVYQRMIGRNAKFNSVFSIGLYNAIRDNEELLFDISIGGLGQTLSNNNLKTAVVGNADISTDYINENMHREPVSLAMKNDGQVNFGDVGVGLIEKDESAPFGISSNLSSLFTSTLNAINKADFVVVDFGDTVRADLYKPFISDKLADKYKFNSLKKAGIFLNKLKPYLKNGDTTLIVASMVPPGTNNIDSNSDNQQLTPVLINGRTWGKGTLTSQVTHRNGIITNIELAPTIMKALNVAQPPSFPGKPFTVEGSTGTQSAALAEFNIKAIAQKGSRRTLILSFIYFQVVIYLIAAYLLVTKKTYSDLIHKILRILLFAVISFAGITYLTSQYMTILSPTMLTLATFALAIGFSVLLQFIFKSDSIYSIMVILGGTLLLLLVNTLFFKSSLQLGSTFGYDPISGSRYFGIGNESMSIIIASSLLFMGLLLEKIKIKKNYILQLVFFVLVIGIIGFPRFGAQTDAPVTAGLAFAAAFFQVNKPNIRWLWAYIVGLVVGVLAVFMAYDFLSGANSHMGRTVELARSGGIKDITLIIQRKLMMNLKLLRVSTWSYFLLGMFALMLVIKQRPIGLFKTVINKYKYVSASITGGIVGGIVGFVINDSGIVVPAIIASYFIGVIMILMIDERHTEFASK